MRLVTEAGLASPLVDLCLAPVERTPRLARPRAPHRPSRSLCELFLTALGGGGGGGIGGGGDGSDPPTRKTGVAPPLATLAFSTRLIPSLWDHVLSPGQVDPEDWATAATLPDAQR